MPVLFWVFIGMSSAIGVIEVARDCPKHIVVPVVEKKHVDTDCFGSDKPCLIGFEESAK